MRQDPPLSRPESGVSPELSPRRSRRAWGLCALGLLAVFAWRGEAGALTGSTQKAVVFAREAGPLKTPTEYQLKAAYLLNFLKLTEWPEESFDDKDEKKPDPFTVVVIGKDPFEEELDKTFKGQTAQGRSVRAVRLRDLPDEDEEIDGHLVFSALSKTRDRNELLERLSGRAVLLVGEEDGLAEDGAHINFYLADKRVKFEVNVDSVKRSNLEISATLLKLAKIVHEEKKGPGQR